LNGSPSLLLTIWFNLQASSARSSCSGISLVRVPVWSFVTLVTGSSVTLVTTSSCVTHRRTTSMVEEPDKRSKQLQRRRNETCQISVVSICLLSYKVSSQHSTTNFLQGIPRIEVCRDSIECKVCHPAFAPKKGGLRAKHEVGCELISAVRELELFVGEYFAGW